MGTARRYILRPSPIQVKKELAQATCNLFKEKENLAPRAGFEPAACRLTAERIKNLSALSGVAYKKLGAIFPALVAPNPAPTLDKAF
jgi:hypothetical protein